MSFFSNLLSKSKSIFRFIFMKTIGACLAVFFLGLAAFFLAYPFASVVTGRGGEEAKVLSVADHMGKLKTGWRVGGLFQVGVDLHKKKFDRIYCFYPAWPDQLQPLKGDVVKVWPAKKPLFGAPAIDGWGWFVVGTVLILGLVMLELAFLSLALH